MGRNTDFSDKTIKKGFGPDKEKKLTVKEGQRLIVRVVTGLTEYLSHAIHDILPGKRDQKSGAMIPSVFNANCGRAWSDKDDDYVGACVFHDKDYDVTERYVAGVMVLGMIQGKTVIPFAPADAGKFWDMTAGRVAELRKVIENKYPELEADKVGAKLRQTTLVLALKDEGGAEMYQKLTINVWEGSPIAITEEHKEAYKAEIPQILKEVSAPATAEEQARRLKRRNDSPTPAAAGGQAPEQAEDNLDDLDLDGAGTAPAPAAAAKPTRATRAPAAAKAAAAPAKTATATATVEDDLGDLGAEEPAAEEPAVEEPAPAPPPAKKAAPAAKKTAVAAAASTKKASDAVAEEMLDGLDSL